MVDGVYVIDSFEFTAFCLLESAEPCFESASLSVFSAGDFREQYSAMMQELKKCYSNSILGLHDEAEDNNLMEGGETPLEQNMELLNEQEMEQEEVLTDPSEPMHEEPAENFEAQTDPEQQEENAEEDEQIFRLAGQDLDELISALSVPTVQTEWGEMHQYSYVDHDPERGEVYAYDTQDWNLYGLPYEMNGDHVEIDFAQKRRKKFDIVDFDEGEQRNVFSEMYARMTDTYVQTANELDTLRAECEELRQFRAQIEHEAAQAAIDEVFQEFEDLAQNETFEALRQNCDGISPEDLRERCYAIRGRMMAPTAKFSVEPKPNKLPVAPMLDMGYAKDDEPYGGLFVEYGND